MLAVSADTIKLMILWSILATKEIKASKRRVIYSLIQMTRLVYPKKRSSLEQVRADRILQCLLVSNQIMVQSHLQIRLILATITPMISLIHHVLKRIRQIWLKSRMMFLMI